MTDRSAIHGAQRRQLLAERTTVRAVSVEPEPSDAVVEYVRQVQQWRRSALDHGAAPWTTTHASGG
jgi:hypothetical protein